METLTDTQLTELSQRGDRRAFGLLARRWHGRLFRFLCRLLGDQEDARDACQETLLKAWLNIRRLKDPSSFKAWVHRIAINLSRDRHRAGRARIQEQSDDGLDERARPDSPADLTALLTELLGRLPREQRTAIVLKELEGYTSAEIAELTGVPAATVRSRIYYGLKTLRRLLPEGGATRGKA